VTIRSKTGAASVGISVGCATVSLGATDGATSLVDLGNICEVAFFRGKVMLLRS